MSSVLLPFALLTTFLSVILIAVALELSRADRRRAMHVLQAQVGRAALNLREEELSRPFAERALLPVVKGLRTVGLRLTPVGMRRRLARKLVLAGSPAGWDAEKLAALKMVGGGGGLALGFALSQVLPVEGVRSIGLMALLSAIGFLLPDGMTDAAAKRRQERIRKELPDSIDLLTISVEAGLSFDAALAQVVRSSPGPLAVEIGRTLQEVRLGVSRVDALRNLAERSSVEELRSFVLAVVQAEVFGVSTTKVLRAQSRELRIKRRQRAEMKSMQVPVKILFPLIFCILPALFVVILGPAAIRIMRDFFGIL